MFELDLAVGKRKNGSLKVLFIGERSLDAAVKAYKEAGEEFSRVGVWHIPNMMMERDPGQEAEMLAHRNADTEILKRTSINKLKNAAAELQAEAKKNAAEAQKLLADAEAAEKALTEAAKPKK